MNALPKDFQWINKLKKYEGNPVIRPNDKYDMVFNPAAIVINDEVRLLCRCIDLRKIPKGNEHNWSVSELVWARSKDGVSFTLDDEPFLCPDESSPYQGGFEDPRLVYVPDQQLYVLTYTGVRSSANTPGLIAFSKDLENWEFGGEQFPSRAVCIFPKKINGKYYAYHGNSSICVSWSEDLRNWHTEDKEAFAKRPNHFDASLCEGTAAPIEGEEGLLFIYNGACKTNEEIAVNNAYKKYRFYSTGSTYSVGYVVFDKKEPEKVIYRCEEPFLFPENPIEINGLVGYTIFANGVVNFKGKYHIYYGCNDTRIGVAIEE